VMTERQLEVLALVCEGKQNKMIAFAMGIAEATVKVHIRTLSKAFGARNRTELAVKAFRTGTVPL
jgi:DNA-binding NarL/FixJ family response regulator